MTLQKPNNLNHQQARDALFACCGSTAWVNQLMQQFPFASAENLVAGATTTWYSICGEVDYREAFTHHPKIGDSKSLQEKFASTQHLAGAEQAGVTVASNELIKQLAAANKP